MGFVSLLTNSEFHLHLSRLMFDRWLHIDDVGNQNLVKVQRLPIILSHFILSSFSSSSPSSVLQRLGVQPVRLHSCHLLLGLPLTYGP